MYLRNMERQGLGMYFAKECGSLGPFFAVVQRHLSPGNRLLEVGYGPGVLGIYLSRCGYGVLGIDTEPDVIDLARAVNERLGGAADFKVCDPFEIDRTFGPNSFDAVVSDVTLEHFSDGDIIEAIQKQLVVARLNVFAVHCANLPPQFFSGLDGGERLLTPSYWNSLIRRAGGQVIDRFGYGFFYTHMGQWNWRISTIAEGILYRKLAGLAAVTGFVVRRRDEEKPERHVLRGDGRARGSNRLPLMGA
jgi:SAM-dependent methyltransferase